MSGEQLQSLFAGMERHLDKRADVMEERLGKRIDAMGDRVTAVEERLIAEMTARMETLETKLLTEFHKWASPTEARARQCGESAGARSRTRGAEGTRRETGRPPHAVSRKDGCSFNDRG